MKMKKLIALAVAAAVMSPMVAMADNTPSNVGDVTLLGNIVANNPMWQWAVNDYSGPSLDAQAGSATTVDGLTTYKLNGESFIAVSGYLPSFTSVAGPSSAKLGHADLTELADGSGTPVADIKDAQQGAVTFTITANGKDAQGLDVQGKLTVHSTEIRGYRLALSVNQRKTNKQTVQYGGNRALFPIQGGSCFSGIGSFSSNNVILSGTSEEPSAVEQSATAFAAWRNALDSADDAGNAPQFISLEGYSENKAMGRSDTCAVMSASDYRGFPRTYSADYLSAAHVMELTPIQLTFDTPISGAWNATLNVTAYQM